MTNLDGLPSDEMYQGLYTSDNYSLRSVSLQAQVSQLIPKLAVNSKKNLEREHLDIEQNHHDLNKPPAIDRCKPVTSSLRTGKRLSLQVSGDLHRQLKMLALDEEETMNSLIVGILRNYLRNREKTIARMNPSFRK